MTNPAADRTVSERKLAEAVAGAIKTQLTQPECLDRFVAAFNERFNELQGGDDGGVKALERQRAKAETRLRNLMDAFAKVGFSEALFNQLKVEEESVAALKGKLAAATRARRPKVLPHPKVIRSYIENLLAVLETDKVRAREFLARHMPPLVLTPDADGYRVSRGSNLAVMLDEVAAAPGVTAEKSMTSEVGGTGISFYRTVPTFRVYVAAAGR